MKRVEIVVLSLALLLTLFGLLMIFDASSYIAFRDFGDKYYYIKEQFIWSILGFIALFLFWMFDYRRLYVLALPILACAIISLVLVFLPGIGVYVLGAHRWIHIGKLVIQPAEFVKLALAIYLAAWFSQKEKGRFFAFTLLMGFVLFLIFLQPDMGTAGVILFEALVIYFVSGGSLAILGLVAPIVALGGLILVKLSPYRAARLATFLNPSEQTLTSSYHVKQILIALGMGGFTGVGFGNSLQKYAYLPENTTDSIFAIIAEELGFVGSVVVIGSLLLLVWHGFVISARAKDQFGKLLAAGITSFLAVQMIINLSAQTALMPLTGIPLPFISYGGSALVLDLAGVGVLLNIAKQSHS